MVLGENQAIQKMSDDGEPSGTAGVPMLEVLKKQKIENTLAIVTRYFGGTKLGAGGLIRAYSKSVSEAIQSIGLVQGTLQQEVVITIDYSQHNALDYYLNQNNYTIADTIFTDQVQVLVMVNEEMTGDFVEKITNLLNAQVNLTLGQTKYFEQSIY